MGIIKNVKRYLVTICFTVIIILVNVGVFYNFYTNTHQNLKEQTNVYLNNTVEEASGAVNIKIDERFNTLEAIAMYIGTYANDDLKNVSSMIDAQIDVYGFNDYDIINEKGKGMKIKGSLDYSEYGFVEKVFKGKNALVKLLDGEGNPYAVGFAVPVYSAEKVKSVFLSICNFENFSEFTEVSTFGNNGNVFLVEKDGLILTRGNGLDEVDYINQILTDDSKANIKLLNSMKQKSVGNVSYGNSSHRSYLCFSKIKYNKWYIVAVVSADTVEEQTVLVQDEGVTLIVEIGVLLFLLILYFIYLVLSQIRSGQVNKQRYFIVSDNSDTAIIDYSIKKDTMFSNEKWNQLFGYNLPKENVKDGMLEHVYEEDKEKFAKRVEKLAKLKKDRDCVKFSVRILNSENEPVLCFVKFYVIKGARNKITKILGVFESINSEYKNFVLGAVNDKNDTESIENDENVENTVENNADTAEKVSNEK